MAEPRDEEDDEPFYEDQMSTFSLEDLIPRGRMVDRVYVRCNRSQSCGHHHMDTSPSPCRPSSSGECRICCKCGGSAYTASEYRTSISPVISQANEYERSRSSSRSSSEERRLDQFRNISTPVFEAMRENLMQLGFEEGGVLDLDKETFTANPDHIDRLVNNPDPKIRQAVEESMYRMASSSGEEEEEEEGRFSDESQFSIDNATF